jgi:serine/threonine-protein kinase
MEGQLIGQYRVTGVLGKGGMGTVYSAQHTLLDRLAAVKVLLPKLSREQEMVTRFFNEARAATAIRHPGIVAVYEYGRTDDGSAFIVMEYLEGETLRERCKGTRLRWSTALAFVRQIAGALGAAHAKGIVHRDLKPDNIFLVPDPEVPGGERIKLLDFGIARLAGPVPSGHKTQTGTLMGTPLYMAPEQCRGVTVDSRADIYSLGCILFELCTGQPPFSGEGEGDLFVAHIREKPPTIASLASGVPKEIEDLVQRMLAKAPADRVQTASELIKLIDAAKAAIGRLGRSGSYPALAPLVVTDEDGDVDDDGDGDGARDSSTSADLQEPAGAGVALTLPERSSSRRSRRDAVSGPLPVTVEQQSAAPAAPTAAAAPTMAAAQRVAAAATVAEAATVAAAQTGAGASTVAVAPARPGRSLLETTLSSGIAVREDSLEDVEPPPRGRRLAVFGAVAGGIATVGVLTLMFGALSGGGGEAPTQAAASSPIAESPPAKETLPTTDTAAPTLQPAAPTPQPAAPTPQPAAPTPQPAAPTPQPAAPTPSTAPAAPAPAPAPKSPTKPEVRALPLPSAHGGDTKAPAKESRFQATEVLITVHSAPPGAAIYRGDSYFGKTPQSFTLLRGDYEFKLELRLAGHETQEIVVRPTEPVRKSVKLKRAPASPSKSPSQPSPQAPPQQPASPPAPAAQPAAPAPPS